MLPKLKDAYVCHETIYNAIYALPVGELRKELVHCLRHGKTTRRPRAGGVDRRNHIPDMVSIHLRPPEIEDRLVPGHWEGDLIKGKGNASAVGTLVMRKSANRVIQTSLENDGQLNDEVKERVKAHLEQLRHDSNNGCQKRLQKIPYMHRINQLLEVVIMLLPAVSLRHMDVDSANQHLKKAKMQLGIK